MIYTLIADISLFDADKFISKIYQSSFNEEYPKCDFISGDYPAPPLGDEVLEHIKKANEFGLRKERCAAYLLLSYAAYTLLGRMPKVLFSAGGKPFFENEKNIYFNLSHSDNMVAVTLSDECSVGVDIEKEIPLERAERLEKRFFSELSVRASSIRVDYFVCKILENGEIRLSAVSKKEEPFAEDCGVDIISVDQYESFGARWTLYEASLKCNGGGFTSLPCLGMLLLETRADIIKIVTKRATYYVCTASA